MLSDNMYGLSYDANEYVLTEDTLPAADKTYYTMVETDDPPGEVSYDPVEIETVDPSKEGYYELNDANEYVLTKDTVPAADKTYYVKEETDDQDAEGFEYDGEIQPVKAIRGHWIKVTFKARINDKTLEEVKKGYQKVSASDVDKDRAPDNKGNAPVISAEDHTGIPNDASYTIGVANEAGIQGDVYGDSSNIVTVKPKAKTNNEDAPKDNKDDDVAPDDQGLKNKGGTGGTGTGDGTPAGLMLLALLTSAITMVILRRNRRRTDQGR